MTLCHPRFSYCLFDVLRFDRKALPAHLSDLRDGNKRLRIDALNQFRGSIKLPLRDHTEYAKPFLTESACFDTDHRDACLQPIQESAAKFLEFLGNDEDLDLRQVYLSGRIYE